MMMKRVRKTDKLMAVLHCSLLGRIIRVTEEVIKYRQWIKETFPVPENYTIGPVVIPCTFAEVVAQHSSAESTKDSNR